LKGKNEFINSKVMRNTNKLKVLELIRTEPGITRNLISSVSELDISTVSKIISDLMDRKAVIEKGLVYSRLGRHSKKLFLNKDFSNFLILDLGVNSSVLSVGYFDTSFDTVEEFETHRDPEEFFEILNQKIKSNPFLESAANNFTIIGVPGMVNSTHQKILFAPNLKWNDIDVSKLLPLFHIYLENDSNLAVIAEQFENTDRRSKPSNFLYIFMREGIGGGIITNGTLYKGAFNSAGEIGHMKISDENECFCGRKGCWETFVSISRVANEYEKPSGKKLDGKTSYERFRNICKLYEVNDIHAKKVFKKFSEKFATGITNLVNILSPESVIIGGEGVFIPDEIIDVVRDKVKGSVLWVNNGIEIVKSSLNQTNVTVKGAAITASRLISKKVLSE